MKHFFPYLSGTLVLTCAVGLFAQNELTVGPQPLSLRSDRNANTVIDITAAMAGIKQPAVMSAQGPHRIAGTEPFDLPYQDNFATDINGYTVVNANNDGSTWEWHEENNCARYQYCDDNVGDDWLISPDIKMLGGRTYKVIIEVSAALTRQPERVEVKWGQGKTAEAMSNDLIAPTVIEGRYMRAIEAEFRTMSDGNYHIGIHAISDPKRGRLWLGSLKVEEVPMKVAPDFVTNLKVVPDPQAELKATVMFTAPDKAVDGSEITNLDYIEVRNNNVLVETIDNVVPGQDYSCVDNNAHQGFDNLYTVTAFKDGFPGMTAEISAYVGLDVPTRPLVKADDMNGSVKLSWPPVEGANGGAVPASSVTFKVFNYESAFMDIITELKGQYEYTIEDVDCNADDTQYLRNWSVQAVNDAGESNYGVAAVIMGKPYMTPYNISFRNGTLENQFMAQSHSSMRDYWWGTTSYDCQDDDNGSISLTCNKPSDGEFHTGKIMLDRSAKSKLSFYYKAEYELPGVFYVTVMHKDGTVDGPLFEVDLNGNDNDDWHRVVVDMPAPKSDDDYVTVSFHADMTAEIKNNLYVDNISIFKDANDDATISLKTRESVVLGQDAEIVAEMLNVGVNDIEGAKIQVFVNDELAGETTLTEPLATLHKVEFPVKYRTNTVNAAEEYNVRAVVVYNKDENASNNQTSVTIAAAKADVDSPRNLEASDSNPVNLTWDAPAYEIAKVTDDFESYEPWSTEFGNWTTIDLDEGYAGPLNAALVYPHQYEQFAFMAWRPSDYFNANQGIDPHSGEIALVSIYQQDYEHKGYIEDDNWLISPLLSGNSQNISFWVNNKRRDQFGIETFEILTSTTGKNPSDFKVLESHTKSDGEWLKISFDVPEGTRFFAIHHTTEEAKAYVFMLDDFTYEGSSAPESYNVYRDGELIGSVFEPGFADNVPDPKATYRYDVTAVYNRGYESAPIFTVKSELIETLEEQNETFNVFTVGGVQLLKDASTLHGLEPGIYIINGEKVYLRK